MVEQVVLVGVALAAIVGFARFGTALHAQLDEEARHIQGKGVPGNVNLAGMLSSFEPRVCRGGSCQCFGAGTLVATEAGERAIENIRVGDRVWASDPETGELALRPVLERFVTSDQPIIRVELRSELGFTERLMVTPGHRFWVRGRGWLRAEALSRDALQSLDAVAVGAATVSVSERATVYNLEVDELHDYFVGRARVLVHNAEADAFRPFDCGAARPPDGASGATPVGPPPATAAVTAPAAPGATPPQRPVLECGADGSYQQDLGAGDKAESAPRASGTNLQRDHIPQKKSSKIRADQLLLQELDERMSRQMNQDCRHLTLEEEQAIKADLSNEAARVARKGLAQQVENEGFAVAIPAPLHTKGRTYGNSRLAPTDAADLAQAARADMQRYEDILDAHIAAGTVTRECAQKIRDVFARRRGRTKEQYDAELTTIVEAQLREKDPMIQTVVARTLAKYEDCQPSGRRAAP